MSEPRRSFLRFAGVGAITAFIDRLIHPALGATWHQIGTSGGTTHTWQKIQPVQVPTPLKAFTHAGA